MESRRSRMPTSASTTKAMPLPPLLAAATSCAVSSGGSVPRSTDLQSQKESRPAWCRFKKNQVNTSQGYAHICMIQHARQRGVCSGLALCLKHALPAHCLKAHRAVRRAAPAPHASPRTLPSSFLCVQNAKSHIHISHQHFSSSHLSMASRSSCSMGPPSEVEPRVEPSSPTSSFRQNRSRHAMEMATLPGQKDAEQQSTSEARLRAGKHAGMQGAQPARRPRVHQALIHVYVNLQAMYRDCVHVCGLQNICERFPAFHAPTHATQSALTSRLARPRSGCLPAWPRLPDPKRPQRFGTAASPAGRRLRCPRSCWTQSPAADATTNILNAFVGTRACMRTRRALSATAVEPATHFALWVG